MAAVVPKKGVTTYSLAELQRFVLEVGRTNGILQTDQEAAIKLLAKQAAIQLSMTPGLSTYLLFQLSRGGREMASRTMGSCEDYEGSHQAEL